MTNSGKRILIQVRKPLLSTSALKHRGVAIIFNHVETRQRIWYLTIVIPTYTSLWQMESRLAERW